MAVIEEKALQRTRITNGNIMKAAQRLGWICGSEIDVSLCFRYGHLIFFFFLSPLRLLRKMHLASQLALPRACPLPGALRFHSDDY